MFYININRKSSISISKQIYIFIKENILNGSIKHDEKLPSSRELAKDINVSRNVVLESYEQLIAEGYLYSKNGSGTYVCDGIIFNISNEVNSNNKETVNDKNEDIISFRTGIPDLDLIPIKKWGAVYKKITLQASSKYMDYQDSSGDYTLRYELANYLRRVRGVNTKADNIIITNGAAQAFSLLCNIVSSDEYALVENPLSYGILNTLINKRINIKTIDVDEYGMVTANLPEKSPKLIFTTPSHQFPTGVILKVKRRIELIKYARKHNAFIVEDDYDSEFRFNGNPIESMQSLDSNHVIYVGTFSKTFMPSLRMGYVVLPDSLCNEMKNNKYIDDLHSPVFEQLTMAEFIKEGMLDLHIKRMKSIYLKRRNYLVKCLKSTFNDLVTISGAESGMHLVASFRNINFDQRLMDKIKDNNIEITPLRKHYIINNEEDNRYSNSLIIGYGNTKEIQIEHGIKKLGEIIL